MMRAALLSVAMLLCGAMWGQQLNVTARMSAPERVGYHVWVTYTLTNNETKDQTVHFTMYNTSAYGDDGTKYGVRFIYRDELLYEDFPQSINLPAGIPLKVVMVVANVPAEVKSLAKVTLNLESSDHHKKEFSNANLAIKEPQPNSDNPKTVLNYPWISIKTKECKRYKEDPTQYFTLTSEQDVKVEISKAMAYDEDGNSYEAYVGTGISYFTVQSGIPLPASVSVKNVPTRLKKLLAIKVDLRINGIRYLMQFNNVEFAEPEAATSGATTSGTATSGADDRASFDLKGNVRECRVTLNGATQTYRFDKNGQWTEWNGMDMKMAFPGGIKRDDKGRLSEAKRDDYGEYFHRFTYDDKGHIRTHYICEDMEGGYIETYRRSYEGEVIRIDRRGGFDPDGKPQVTICTIQARDAKGNWIKRKRGTVIETRTISYY